MRRGSVSAFPVPSKEGMVDFRDSIHNNVSYVFELKKWRQRKIQKKARNTEACGMKGKANEIHR
jgi:hypothetical protein